MPAITAAPAALAIEPQTRVETACCRIADGTPVTLEIMESLDSSRVKRGDRFKIRLAQPLLVQGQVVLAAGILGSGEVIHAEKSRGGGKAGELLIAARYLELDGSQIGLRGLKLGGAGKDNSGMAIAVAVAAGPFALFVQGSEIVIPVGTLAQAKIAQTAGLPSQAQPESAPTTAIAVPTTSGSGVLSSTPVAYADPAPLDPAAAQQETLQQTQTPSTQDPKD